MSAQHNIELVRKFVDDVWNNQNFENATQYLSDDYVEHNPMGDFKGIDEFRTYVETVLEIYPDNQINLEEGTGDGQMVAFRYTIEGTQKGNIGSKEPTNEQAKIDACYFGRIEDGKIAEAWYQFDQLSLMVQLGLIELPDFMQELQGQMSGGGERTERGGRTPGRPGA